MLRILVASALLHLKLLAVERFAYVIFLAQPLLVATASMYMLRGRSDFEAVYVVVGTTLTGLWSLVLLFSTGLINSDRFMGVLEYLEASPASMFAIISGRTLSALCFAAVSGMVGYVVASWLFGYSLSISDPEGFAVSVVLTAFSLWSVGMLLAPVSFRWIAFGSFLSGLEYPLYTLCAFLFPVALLPDWLRPVSYAIPAYWGAQALHATSSGAMHSDSVEQYWLLLLATSAVTTVLARLLFQVFLSRSRRRGMVGAV